MTLNFLSGEYYVDRVRSQTRYLQLLIAEQKRLLSPFGPNKFADVLEKITEAIGGFFDFEIKRVTLTNQSEVIDRSKKYLGLLETIHKNYLPFLEAVPEEFVPSEVLRCFTNFITTTNRKLGISTEFELRFFPAWVSNYGLHGYINFVQTLLKGFPTFLYSDPLKDIPTSPEWFIFITYPRIRPRDILLHPNMIHEIGHFVYHEMAVKPTTPLLKFDIKLHKISFEELLSKIKRELPRLSKDREMKLSEKIHTECARIVRNWLMEVFADLFAVRVIGPAYLFAFVELSTLVDVMDKYGDNHPSSTLRLRYLLKELRDLNYFRSKKKNSPLGKLSKFFSDWYKSIETKDLAPILKDDKDPYFLVAYKTLEENFSLIHSEIIKQIGQLHYSPENINSKVYPLAKTLTTGTLPAEFWNKDNRLKEVAEFIDLLNAGWLTFFYEIEKFYRSVRATTVPDKLDALDNFKQLLSKAIESSEISRLWPSAGGP